MHITFTDCSSLHPSPSSLHILQHVIPAKLHSIYCRGNCRVLIAPTVQTKLRNKAVRLKSISTVKCALQIMKPLHSLLWWQWLSSRLSCNMRSMSPRRVTQRAKRKMWNIPYFCIMADSSIVWAFSWGAKTLSELSSCCSTRRTGFCSIISWKSVITLILWSDKHCVFVRL